MDHEPPSVGDLLARARAGHEPCRQQLFEACRPYLGLVARTQVEPWLQAKVDASDLVQETLLEAHRDFARFEGQTEAEWLAWLKRILAHNLSDYVRRFRGTAKRQVGREVPLASGGPSSDQHGAPEPAAAVETPSQQLIRRDGQTWIAAALERLSADHRQVIVLRNLQRLPFDEVARRMGRSRPAVQMLWMRAVRKLEELGAEGSAPS